MNPDTSKGFWLLPTRGHAQDRLPAFLKAAVAAGITTPGLIIVEQDDFDQNIDAYNALDLPHGWAIVVNEGAPTTAGATEWALKTFCEGCGWLGWLSDDLKPETPQWDRRVIEALNGWNFVSTADGVFAPKKANGATIWSGDLVRAVGYLYPPGFEHYYIDDVWETLGRMTGCWQVRMDTMMRHEHDLVTGRTDQMSDAKNSHWPNDERAWERWTKEGLHDAAERVLALMGSKGLKVVKYDLKGVDVMLAVPSGSRRYEGAFMLSYVATRDAVRAAGGNLTLVEMPYASDVVIGRTKLFGTFLRSEHTHLFFVDDDMGWMPADFLKLLSYRKDFVAVAGPRKTNPPSYAVSSQDDHGRPLPIAIDQETELLKPNRIGMAFAVLSRACCERMAQHYADMTFVTADGREEVGVFLPQILNRRYLGEDFSFAQRWTAIGGTIYVDSAISLQHIGAFTYEGRWIDYLAQLMANQKEVA